MGVVSISEIQVFIYGFLAAAPNWTSSKCKSHRMVSKHVIDNSTVLNHNVSGWFSILEHAQDAYKFSVGLLFFNITCLYSWGNFRIRKLTGQITGKKLTGEVFNL